MKIFDGLRLLAFLAVEFSIGYALASDFDDSSPLAWLLYEATGIPVLQIAIPLALPAALILIYGFSEAGRILIAFGALLPITLLAIGIMLGSPGAGFLFAFGIVAGLVIAGVGSILAAIAKPKNKIPSSNSAAKSKIYYLALAVLMLVPFVLLQLLSPT